MSAPTFCAVVPAGGTGTRMGADTPKQYLDLAGRHVLEWAVDALLAHAGLVRLVLAVPPGDRVADTLRLARDPRVVSVTGGESRAQSVRNALGALAGHDPGTPVLVHDAARPCLGAADIERVLEVAREPGGGLLAIPVRDTLKRVDEEGRVSATVAREALWQALTPQGFLLGPLCAALDAAASAPGISDEASAMELAGHRPRVVEGDPGNIKITRPGDLPLAAALLEARGRTPPH